MIDWEARRCEVLAFVKAQGEHFRAAPRPPGVRKRQDGACFRNAWNVVAQHPEQFTYTEGVACEGVACSDSIDVIHHAWCVSRDGVVVDPTWREPVLAPVITPVKAS